MSELKLSSYYFSNISTVASKVEKNSKDLFTIVINNEHRIELPWMVAALISVSITQILCADQTADEFPVEIDAKGDIRPVIDKIKRVIYGEKVILENDEEKRIFALFGIKIGNNDFVKLYSDVVEAEGKNLSIENAIRILNIKQTLNIENTANEVKFIAENFEKMKSREEFISYMTEAENLHTIEQIIGSENIFLENEDSLLQFLMEITKLSHNNAQFFGLFKFVLLEYCSVETCESFLCFVEEISEAKCISPFISCIRRRFSQSKLPMEPNYVEKRHKPNREEITNEDPLNGILNREHQKGNLILKCTRDRDIFDILNGNEKDMSISGNSTINPFVETEFKEKKTFILKAYTIKSSDYSSLDIRNWDIEGKRESDGQWIKLDSHRNDLGQKYEVRKYKITNQERLTAVKIVQPNTTTNCDWDMHICSFEVFGTLFAN